MVLTLYESEEVHFDIQDPQEQKTDCLKQSLESATNTYPDETIVSKHSKFEATILHIPILYLLGIWLKPVGISYIGYLHIK